MTQRAIVFAEDHTILADAPTRSILASRATLLQANLIHDHDPR